MVYEPYAIEKLGEWWTTSENYTSSAWSRGLTYYENEIASSSAGNFLVCQFAAYKTKKGDHLFTDPRGHCTH